MSKEQTVKYLLVALYAYGMTSMIWQEFICHKHYVWIPIGYTLIWIILIVLLNKFSPKDFSD